MTILHIILVALSIGILVAAILLVRKIRSFHTPPADRNEELSRRVARLLEESRTKDTDRDV